MKRLFSLLLLVAACFLLQACPNTDEDVTLLTEYFGSIESESHDDPMGYSGFNVNFLIYSDYHCILRTALILEDQWTLDGVRHRNCRVIVKDEGFDLVDAEGKIIATATYCGPSLAPQSQILLDWTDPICPEWEEFAETYGWHTPCTMFQYTTQMPIQ